MGELDTLVQSPLLQAMQAYFGLPDDQLPVRLATLFNFDNLTIFSLQNMPKPNYQAVRDVRSSLEKLGSFQSKICLVTINFEIKPLQKVPRSISSMGLVLRRRSAS